MGPSIHANGMPSYIFIPAIQGKQAMKLLSLQVLGGFLEPGVPPFVLRISIRNILLVLFSVPHFMNPHVTCWAHGTRRHYTSDPSRSEFSS